MLRLDQALVERGLCESREKAKRAIIAGQVRVNGQVARKPSDSADESMVDQYRQPAAGRVVDRRGPQRDDEMQENTQQRRACAALECATSKQSAGDTLKQSKRGAAEQRRNYRRAEPVQHPAS